MSEHDRPLCGRAWCTTKHRSTNQSRLHHHLAVWQTTPPHEGEPDFSMRAVLHPGYSDILFAVSAAENALPVSGLQSPFPNEATGFMSIDDARRLRDLLTAVIADAEVQAAQHAGYQEARDAAQDLSIGVAS